MPFKKGQSGNSGGRPKPLVNLQDLARSKTETALNTLICIAEDKEESPSARVAGCSSILDRGWGEPTQTVAAEPEALGALEIRRVIVSPDGTERELADAFGNQELFLGRRTILGQCRDNVEGRHPK